MLSDPANWGNLIIIGLLFLIGCVKQQPFSLEAWNKQKNLHYVERINVVNDLINNHLNDKLCIDNISKLLGMGERLHQLLGNGKLYYEIDVKYGFF